MKYLLALIIIIPIAFACSAPKEYTHKGRLVTKKKLDRKLDRYTRRFVKNSTQEELRLFMELEIVYDTADH